MNEIICTLSVNKCCSVSPSFEIHGDLLSIFLCVLCKVLRWEMNEDDAVCEMSAKSQESVCVHERAGHGLFCIVNVHGEKLT